MTAFVDFGRKTQYSVKNAMGDTKSMLPILAERGQMWFPVSDYGECSGWVGQYFGCVKKGIVPILGMEAFVNNYRFRETDDGKQTVVVKSGEDESWERPDTDVDAEELDWSQIDFPIDIFARTLEGYTNIICIHNESQINGVAKRPRVADGYLKTHGKGIVALLPTPYSEVSTRIYNREYKEALRKYEFYKSIFDAVYVEIPIIENDDYRQINSDVIKFCSRHGIPMVPVINAHYDSIDDEEAFPIFKRCGDIRGGMSYEVDYAPHMYSKTCEEVWDTFRQYHKSKVFTDEVMTDLMMTLGALCLTFKTLDLDTSPKTPHFENSEERLREHAWAGFKKYGFDKMGDEYKERLEFELKNIIGAGFADYFLLIEQMFDWHVNVKHRISSVGRGSAASSLVLRCLGVTKVDPIRHKLPFQRFLSLDRLLEKLANGGKLTGADFPDVDCFSMHTLVISENGIKEIKDVVEGEKMMTRDGSFHAVEKIVDYRNAPVVRVIYGDWYFDCTPNHRLLIKRGDSIEYKYVYELRRGDCLVENETTFIPIEEITQEHIIGMVRDLKIEGKHCFKVCGKAYNRVLLKEGDEFFLSDNELNCARDDRFSDTITSENILEVTGHSEKNVHNNGVVVHNSDFQSNAKEGVKDFFAETYGRDNICSVGSIGYLHVKSTLKELGRAYGIDDKEINELTTEGLKEFGQNEDDGDVPDDALPLEDMCAKFPALAAFLDKYPALSKVFKKLQGTINNWGVHAGGILISDRPLLDQLPVRVNKGKLVSCWSEGLNGRELGEMGFLKLDLLAIETLDIIEEAIDKVNERCPDCRLTFDRIMDIMLENKDKAALARIEQGWNQGVFQFETALALRVVKEMHGIRQFDDIASLSTLMRPAALQNGFGKKYGLRRDGEETYTVPDCMVPYIGNEMGLPIFQEHALFYGYYMAGMNMVDSYVLCKNLYKGKLHKQEDIDYWHDKFINGCMKKIAHKEYEVEFEDGSKRTYTEYDMVKCTDGVSRPIKEAIDGGFEIDGD